MHEWIFLRPFLALMRAFYSKGFISSSEIAKFKCICLGSLLCYINAKQTSENGAINSIWIYFGYFKGNTFVCIRWPQFIAIFKRFINLFIVLVVNIFVVKIANQSKWKINWYVQFAKCWFYWRVLLTFRWKILNYWFDSFIWI